MKTLKTFFLPLLLLFTTLLAACGGGGGGGGTAPATYTVTYSANGSTGGSVPIDTKAYAASTTATVLGNTGVLVKAGYVFTGWNTAADGSGTAYAAGTGLAVGSANVTLYAVWVPTHSVRYDGNGYTGGTAPVDATAYVAGTSATVLGNTGTLVKAGDFFTGWNTAADGSGTAYAPGASITIGSVDVTLYAVWGHQMGGSVQGKALALSTQVTTLAGTASNSGAADGMGAAARFSYPFGITTDGTHLYVADSNNDTIRKVVIATGVVTTLAGTAGSSGSVDGTGAAARFSSPYGITTDGTHLYVADLVNQTIRKVVIATGVVTTLAGTVGSRGSADGTGAAARFSNPIGITTDGTHLYVADLDNVTIRKVVIATGVVTTLAGTARSSGSADGTGAAARFSNPIGITTDGTHLYVADTSNHTIRKVVIATGAVTTLAGTASSYGAVDGTGAAARFNNPYGITTDGTHLYVADLGNQTIRKVVIATGEVSTLAGTAGGDESADGTGAAARFNLPIGITTDGTGLYVTDGQHNTIRKIQ